MADVEFDSEAGDAVLKELIANSNIPDQIKKELLGLNLRSIFDPLSHHYKEMEEGRRVMLFKAIMTSDVYFGSFLENLVVWLEEVSMGIALVNIGEAIQENSRKLLR